MSDTVTIPATGSGSTTPVIATDDVSGVHYQRVKLVDGTADSTALIPGDASNGLDVDVTRTINSNPLDYDTGAGSVSQGLVGIALPASGGPVGVSQSNPLPTSPGTLTPSAGAAATVGSSSAQGLAANASRKAMYLSNSDQSLVIWLGFGATAVIGSGVPLNPGATLGPYPNVTTAVNAIGATTAGAATAGANLAIQEYT